jgi:hypothetical protein
LWRRAKFSYCYEVRHLDGHWLPLYLYGVQCAPLKRYVYDQDHFRVVKGSQWFVNGTIQFPPSRTYEKKIVRWLLGPLFCHSGIVYEKSDVNLIYASYRMLSIREPDQPGLHQNLFDAQIAFMSVVRPEVLGFKKHVRKWFPMSMSFDDEFLSRYHLPHPKRALRLAAGKDLLQGRFARRTQTNVVNYFQKLLEFAKVGKWPRAVGDLGTHASLIGFFLTEFIKKGMTQAPYEFSGGHVIILPNAQSDELQRAFDLLIRCPGKFVFLIYSDDSCFAYRNGDRVLRANMDITSCDGSHTDALFDFLVSLCPGRYKDVARALVQQCARPFEVRNYDGDCAVRFQASGPRLFSGSTLTTALNNCANFLICVAVVARPLVDLAQVPYRASRVGYLVTLDPVDRVEDYQFLKCSPVLDVSGIYQPVQNLGVVFRAFGACKSPVLRRNAPAFAASTVAAFFTNVRHQLADLLRERFPNPGRRFSSMLNEPLRLHVVTPMVFDLQQVFLRYRATSQELQSLLALLSVSEVGKSYQHPLIDRILAIDYGL